MTERIKKLLGDDQRTALMRKNIAASFLVKGWSGLVMLLLVPATLHCLGEYKNGIWLTISSMLIWIDNLDIGLGNGLRNQLAAHLAHGDTAKARETVSTTFIMLAVIIIPVMLTAVGLAHATDLYSFLNVDSKQVSDLTNVVVVSIILVSSTFIFKFIGNFYLGMQLPAVSNLLVTIGQTLALVATCCVYYTGSGSLMNIAIVNTAAPLATYLLAYPYTFHVRYPQLRPSLRLFNKQAVRGLFSVGVKFFVLQIAGILLFMSSNILISKLLSPAIVTPYQIAYRYYSLVMILFTIISTPYWSATTDAWERGDLAWIRHSRRDMNRIMLMMGALLTVMTLVATPVYRLWVGSEVEVPTMLSILMAIYLFVILTSMSYSYFLNGVGALTIQLICTVTAATLFIPLSCLMVKHVQHDVCSILLTMIAVNLPGLVVNKIQFDKIIYAKAHGIWTR